jgi:hypothetical protein
MSDRGLCVQPPVKKYMLFPGPVRGSDGEVHNLSGQQLADCYGVWVEECYIIRNTVEWHGIIDKVPSLPHLFPRDDGRYRDNYTDVADQIMRRSVLDPPGRTR